MDGQQLKMSMGAETLPYGIFPTKTDLETGFVDIFATQKLRR